PFELSGRVEGWPGRPGRLRLLDLGPQSSATDTAIDSTGAFRMQGAMAGLYRVVLEGLPESSYVKRVVRGTTEMADRILDLRGPGEAISIEAASGAARVSGVVSDTNGPVSGALVALFPEGPRANDLRIMVNAGTDGRYALSGLAPGRYSL